MKLQTVLGAAGAAVLLASIALPAASQALSDPVLPAKDPEALFVSKDPKLNRNKQAALHIMKDLLESHRWSEADKWLTQKYIQHNPQAASGLPGVITFFTQVLRQQPLPLQNPTKLQIVAVQAEGDY